MLIENVFFDLDGTLVDSLPGIAFSLDEALAQCGYPQRTRGLRALIGPPIRHILRAVSAEENAPRLDALERAFRASYDSDGWMKTVLFQDARETLAALRASGAQLFLVTNKPAHPTSRILDYFGIREQFTEWWSRDSVKPPFASKADMLCHAMERHHLEAGRSLLVGDTAEDCEAGARAGVAVIVVMHGYGNFDGNVSARPRASIGRLQDLTTVCNTTGVL